MRFDKFVAHSSVHNKLFQLCAIVRGITGRYRGHRKRSRYRAPYSQPTPGTRNPLHLKPQSAGKGVPQPRQQRVFFARRIRFSGFRLANLYQGTHRRKYIVRTGLLVYRIRTMQTLLKIQQHVHNPSRRIRAQPVPDAIVVNWQFTENVFRMTLQLQQKIFIFYLVKNVARCDRKCCANPRFAIARNPR